MLKRFPLQAPRSWPPPPPASCCGSSPLPVPFPALLHATNHASCEGLFPCRPLPAGSTFVAAATSRQLLRLFSLAGSQTLIARLDGPPVAMAAAGSVLMVVWHAGGIGCTERHVSYRGCARDGGTCSWWCGTVGGWVADD